MQQPANDCSIVKNKNPQDWEGETPLHYAVKNPGKQCLDVVKILIKNGARPDIKDNKGQTPFSILCYQIATGIDIAYLTFPLFQSDMRLWESLNILLQECSTNIDGVVFA